MRLEQKLLKGQVPVFQYSRLVNGTKATVIGYDKPEFCVNIITDKYKHCYPCTFEQFEHYRMEAEEWNNPNVHFLLAKIKHCDYKFKEAENLNMKLFWQHAKEGFIQRLPEPERQLYKEVNE